MTLPWVAGSTSNTMRQASLMPELLSAWHSRRARLNSKGSTIRLEPSSFTTVVTAKQWRGYGVLASQRHVCEQRPDLFSERRLARITFAVRNPRIETLNSRRVFHGDTEGTDEIEEGTLAFWRVLRELCDLSGQRILSE